jgi:hypothetical protein
MLEVYCTSDEEIRRPDCTPERSPEGGTRAPSCYSLRQTDRPDPISPVWETVGDVLAVVATWYCWPLLTDIVIPYQPAQRPWSDR